MKQCFMLQIPDLKEHIAEFLGDNLTSENVTSFLNASLRYKEQKLYEKSFKYILKNAEKVLLTQDFSNEITENEFIKLLGNSLLSIYNQ